MASSTASSWLVSSSRSGMRNGIPACLILCLARTSRWLIVAGDMRSAEAIVVAFSQPISGLGLGPTAPFMNAAFVVSGLLIMVGVVGIFQGIQEIGAVARWSCTALLALSGVGAVVVGIFTLESFLVHFVGVLLAVATPVLSFLISGLVLRRVSRWRRFGSWLLLGTPLTLALLVLFFATFDPTAAGANLGMSGLTQRILVVEIHAWYVALGSLAFWRS